jgi:hypothetical protein
LPEQVYILGISAPFPKASIHSASDMAEPFCAQCATWNPGVGPSGDLQQPDMMRLFFWGGRKPVNLG